MERKERIVVFGAHNDDLVIGAGGTVAKYAKEGKRITSVIFSYGEMGLPQFKKEISISIRAKEAKKANSILGIDKVVYIGADEGKFLEQKRKITSSVKEILNKERPAKVFMHSLDDAHPDHRAVNSIVSEILKKEGFEGEVYTYQVWNILSFQKKDKPQLIVDITDTFRLKTKAFRAHKSQKMVLITLMWKVYLQAALNGIRNRVRLAEVFYKER